MTTKETAPAVTEPVTMPTSIEDALDFEFTGWNPEPGDKVAGTIIGKGTSSEGDFGTYPILNVVTFDGIGVALHCFHTLLRGTAEDANVGDQIGVKYKGVRKSGSSDFSYADYNVILRRQQPEQPALPA